MFRFIKKKTCLLAHSAKRERRDLFIARFTLFISIRSIIVLISIIIIIIIIILIVSIIIIITIYCIIIMIKSITSILILIVLIYAACNSIRCFFNITELMFAFSGIVVIIKLTNWPITNLFEFYLFFYSGSETAGWGHELTILVSASHLLVTINCSSNFAIYCAKVCISVYFGR